MNFKPKCCTRVFFGFTNVGFWTLYVQNFSAPNHKNMTGENGKNKVRRLEKKMRLNLNSLTCVTSDRNVTTCINLLRLNEVHIQALCKLRYIFGPTHSNEVETIHAT